MCFLASNAAAKIRIFSFTATLLRKISENVLFPSINCLILQPEIADTSNNILQKMSERFVSIFAGRATKELGNKIAEAYGIPLGKSSVVVFSDGEFQPSFEESIRGRHVYIVQSDRKSVV